MSKPLEVSTEDGWKIFNWFAHIEYSKKNNMLECSVSPKLKPYLLELKENFKSYDLKYILDMQSEYSIRIYELLKKSEKMGYLEIDLVELQELLQVPDSFKVYADFKRKVLQPTSIEIAKYTDIYFEFKEIKSGRKVAKIKFIIKKNIQNLTAEMDYEFKKFREHIIKEYEGLPVLFHPQLERHIMIRDSLLVIEESGTIIKSERALELWNFIYKNQSIILTKTYVLGFAMKNKNEIFNDITDFLNSVEDIECYMFMIRGLIDENIKLEEKTEIAQMKDFVNRFYFLVKDIEKFNNTL